MKVELRGVFGRNCSRGYRHLILTLVLFTFGARMGFSPVSRWSPGPSSTTVGVLAGI
jgi:hypothetical protein